MSYLFRQLHRFAKLYWRIRRPLSVGVKGIVLDGDQRVLLIRHTYQNGWHLPGGAVEKGETLLESACREILEETGIRCAAQPEKLLGAFSNFSEFKRDYVIVFVFKDWERTESFLAPNMEIEEANFFGRGEFPADTSKATLRRLDEYFNGSLQDFIW